MQGFDKSTFVCWEGLCQAKEAIARYRLTRMHAEAESNPISSTRSVRANAVRPLNKDIQIASAAVLSEPPECYLRLPWSVGRPPTAEQICKEIHDGLIGRDRIKQTVRGR